MPRDGRPPEMRTNLEELRSQLLKCAMGAHDLERLIPHVLSYRDIPKSHPDWKNNGKIFRQLAQVTAAFRVAKQSAQTVRELMNDGAAADVDRLFPRGPAATPWSAELGLLARRFEKGWATLVNRMHRGRLEFPAGTIERLKDDGEQFGRAYDRVRDAMHATSPSVIAVADKLSRLKAVQLRVRDLAGKCSRFADAIRQASTTRYEALCNRHDIEQAALHDRARALARHVLATGFLNHPHAGEMPEVLWVSFNGLCPAPLAQQILALPKGTRLPRALEQEAARAALKAFDRDVAYRSSEPASDARTAMETEREAALDAGTHVELCWRVCVARPADWREPFNPHSLERDHLSRLTDDDFRTVALYRLGGLADAGLARPIVPMPPDTRDLAGQRAYSMWEARFPTVIGDGSQQFEPLCADRFPPDVAEEMLEHAERWVDEMMPMRGDDDRGIGGTKTDWKDVQGRLLAMRERGEPFTSLRQLAGDLHCSDATIRKAIRTSDTLKGWKARSATQKASPKATDLNAVVRGKTPQTTEPAPDDVLSDDDVDATMALLIDQAQPHERAQLHALDANGRRALAATFQAQNLDVEPSPLELDKPGERPARVRQHKRA